MRESSDLRNSVEETPARRPTAKSASTEEPLHRRWWVHLLVQPILLLASGSLLIAGLGVAQRCGFIASGGSGHGHASSGAADSRYICPMMCTPPQTEPGRCPVCAMELVPAAAGGGNADSRAVQIDVAARRVANIQTVGATPMTMTRTISAIGELAYDEGSLRTLSAYVDGRLEKLYADFTGVVVQRGDPLALLYSPKLYSSQVEFVLAKRARDESRNSTLQRVAQSNQELYASARQRLVELGMSESQIAALEQSGEANSRLQLIAPISGTVIKKIAVEGSYVKEGDEICQLADLSTVWLMLRLFPQDAAAIRYGQKVEAEVQSLPGQKFPGRVAFIDPHVDPKTRTVGVRVVMPNEQGMLRVGDYAKATIDVPLSAVSQTVAYDPELADKWISPRHPQVISDTPGACPICGVPLVPARELGFTDEPLANSNALAVPRSAVLSAGGTSVLYVETQPGRFEIRCVELGPVCGDQIVVRSGLNPGEQVATRGNFLIDSQMQLAGNPSLIDPTRIETLPEGPMTDTALATLAQLSPADRALVEEQRICPVAEFKLGSMGPPKKVDVNGKPVFICCDGCREQLLAEPDKYLAKLKQLKAAPDGEGESDSDDQMDLPPIGVPQALGPFEIAPSVEATAEALDSLPSPRVVELPREGLQ